MRDSRCARRRARTHSWSRARTSERSCFSSDRTRRARPARRPSADDLLLSQRGDDDLRGIFRRSLAGIDDDLGALRRLVRRVDAGEVLDLAFERACIESLRVALLTDLERRVDVDLDELACIDQLAHHAPLCAEGRDERAEDNGAGIDEETGDLAHAANVL